VPDIGAFEFVPPPPPLPPQATEPAVRDVTGLLRIRRQAPQRGPGGRLRQRLTLVNVGGRTLTGRLVLVLDQLGRGFQVERPSGFTRVQPPLGSPYLVVRTGYEGLRPGARLSVMLEFRRWPRSKVAVTFRVLAGPGPF
jgi:hypothetical protein